MKFSFNFFI